MNASVYAYASAMATASAQINLRLTEEEAGTLRALARAAGQTNSEFVRGLVRGAERQAKLERDVQILLAHRAANDGRDVVGEEFRALNASGLAALPED